MASRPAATFAPSSLPPSPCAPLRLLLPMLRAVLSVLPVEAAGRASLMNDPAQKGAIHAEIDALCAGCGQSFTLTPLAGEALYPRVKAAYAIVATSETALYANVILRKAALTAPA